MQGQALNGSFRCISVRKALINRFRNSDLVPFLFSFSLRLFILSTELITKGKLATVEKNLVYNAQ